MSQVPQKVGKSKARRTCINCGLDKSVNAFAKGKGICRRCHGTFGTLVAPEPTTAKAPKLRPNARVCVVCHVPHGPGAYRKGSMVCRKYENTGRAPTLAAAGEEAAKAAEIERQLKQKVFRKLTPGEVMADLPDSCIVIYGTAPAKVVAAVTAALGFVAPNAEIDSPAAAALHASLVVKSLV